MDSQEIIGALMADGWFRVSHKGSHVQFRHETKPGRLTVPHPKHGIPPATLRTIDKSPHTKPG